MDTKLIAISFCWLMVVVYSHPHVLPSMDLEEDIYDLSPDEADNFFRFLLLSKYGLDSSDYPAADQILNDEETEEMPMSFGADEKPMRFDGDEKPMSFEGGEKPMGFDVKGNPMEFDSEEKLLSFDTGEMPYGSEDLSVDDGKLGNSMHPFRQAVQKFHEEHSTTVFIFSNIVTIVIQNKYICE